MPTAKFIAWLCLYLKVLTSNGRMPLNLKAVCRLCMAYEDVLLPIFCTAGPTANFPERIMYLTSVTVSADDGLPQQVCSHCAEQVETLYEFRQQCENSDSTLRQYIKCVNSVFGSTDIFDDDVIIKQEKDSDSESTAGCTEETAASQGATTVASEKEIMKQILPSEGVEADDEITEAFPPIKQETLDEAGETSSSRLSKGMYHCFICDSKFSQELHLKCHLRYHTVKKADPQFKNSKCSKRIANSPNLFKCEQCDKVFYQRAHLLNHKRMHPEALECDVCKKKFCIKSDMQAHVKTHQQETPLDEDEPAGNEYTCEICKQTFTQPDLLAFHIKTHTGERAHKCVMCKMSFATADSLAQHLSSHLDAYNFKQHDKLRKCQICHKSFTQPALLTYHLKTYHKKIVV